MAQLIITQSTLWTVPYDMRKINSAIIVGGGSQLGYYRVSGMAGSVTTIKDIDVSPGQQITVTIGKGGSGFGRDRAGTTVFGNYGSAIGGRSNSSTLHHHEDIGNITYNGTGYGSGADRNISTYAEGGDGAVIINYEVMAIPTGILNDPDTGNEIINRSSVSNVSYILPGDFTDKIWNMKDINNMINVMVGLSAEIQGIADIYFSPAIYQAGTQYQAITNDKKAKRFDWRNQNSIRNSTGVIQAEKKLTINDINNFIGAFNGINTTAVSTAPDSVYTIGQENVDAIPAEYITTYRLWSQMRAKVKRYITYMNSKSSWWDGNDLCARSCQVTCQVSCQVACQGCNNSTCHNQNCGGWS